MQVQATEAAAAKLAVNYIRRQLSEHDIEGIKVTLSRDGSTVTMTFMGRRDRVRTEAHTYSSLKMELVQTALLLAKGVRDRAIMARVTAA